MASLHGLRLAAALASLYIGLLLSSLESTIVSTALVNIADDFKNYNESNWVVITYLLTYSSFLMVYARLSDITGRKAALLTGVSVFTVSSLACGLARTLTQLVIFRAFQGIGGAGIFALTMVIVMEITPKKQIGPVAGALNLVFVVASAVGPVVGGAITSNTTWRWCFYLNVPPGVVIIVLTWFLFPASAPVQPGSDEITWRKSLAKVDWFGLVLLLASTILVITPLEEGGSLAAWNSPLIIVTLTIGGISWFTFAAWQTYLAYRREAHVLLPMVPLKVILPRVIGGCILTSTITGLMFTSNVVYLPQRFQFVNNLSPVEAGIKILPLLLVSAGGNVVGGFIMGKVNLGAWITLLGNALQIIGLGLSSTVPTDAGVPASCYGYQAIVGMGLGISLSGSFLLARIEVKKIDIGQFGVRHSPKQPSVVGVITQLRLLGGVIGLAICRIAQNAYLSGQLPKIVDSSTAALIRTSANQIARLPAEQAAAVRRLYGEAFNFQWRILMYISLINIFFALMTFKRHAKPLDEAEFHTEERREEPAVEPTKTTREEQGPQKESFELAEAPANKGDSI